MTEAGYGRANEPLTPLEMRRLRSSVDVAALERFFVVSKGEARRAVIAHFANEVLVDDLREIAREADEYSAAAGVSVLVDDGDSPVTADEPPIDWPAGALALRFIPSAGQPVVYVWPPDDPSLRAVWNLIET